MSATMAAKTLIETIEKNDARSLVHLKNQELQYIDAAVLDFYRRYLNAFACAFHNIQAYQRFFIKIMRRSLYTDTPIITTMLERIANPFKIGFV
jgi:hypothetical protein